MADETADGEVICYICQKAFEKVQEQLKKNEEISEDSVANLTNHEILKEDDMLTPVDMRGVGEEFEDVAHMLAKLGPKATAEAFVKAKDYFDANKDGEPEDERHVAMSVRQFKSLLEEHAILTSEKEKFVFDAEAMAAGKSIVEERWRFVCKETLAHMLKCLRSSRDLITEQMLRNLTFNDDLTHDAKILTPVDMHGMGVEDLGDHHIETMLWARGPVRTAEAFRKAKVAFDRQPGGPPDLTLRQWWGLLVNDDGGLSSTQECQDVDSLYEKGYRFDKRAKCAALPRAAQTILCHMAFNYYERGANQGHAESRYRLGLMYEEGRGVQENQLQAFESYKLAATARLADAQWKLGMCYMQGRGVKQSSKQSTKYLRLAANQGHAAAQYVLSTMARDRKEAMTLLQSSARQGHAEAQFVLGRFYARGTERFEPQLQTAMRYFKLAADQHYAQAEYILALYYLEGTCVQQNVKRAFQLWQLAAVHGDAAAARRLGALYTSGQGGLGHGWEADKEAFKWHMLAAEQGEAESAFAIALAFGGGIGVDRSMKDAVEFYQKAAKAGHVEAQCELAQIYIAGEFVAQDQRKGVELLRQAAEQRHTKGRLLLANLYRFGCGEALPKNEKRAAQLYKSAADDGISAAQRSLALMHKKGEGVLQDHERAVSLLKQAAAQKDVLAVFELANMYRLGQGVAASGKQAIKLYELVLSLLKSPDGQDDMKIRGCARYELGRIFLKGDHGIACDLQRSHGYLTEAVQDGNADAQFLLATFLAQKGGPEKIVAFLLQSAAQQSHARAQCALGYVHLDRKEYSEALAFLKDAALQNVAEGHFGLGHVYDKGLGVAQDLTYAVKCWQHAADQGYVHAQRKLGLLYADKEHYQLAMKYLQQAIAQGDLASMVRVATMYTHGEGIVSQNYKCALQLYESVVASATSTEEPNPLSMPWRHKGARLQALREAHYALGVCHEGGHGVPQDYVKAGDHYETVATFRVEVAGTDEEEPGHQMESLAQRALGSLYERGCGKPRDLPEALRWYLMAAVSGDVDAHLCVCRLCELNVKETLVKQWLEDAQDRPRADQVNAHLLRACLGLLDTWPARGIHSYRLATIALAGAEATLARRVVDKWTALQTVSADATRTEAAPQSVVSCNEFHLATKVEKEADNHVTQEVQQDLEKDMQEVEKEVQRANAEAKAKKQLCRRAAVSGKSLTTLNAATLSVKVPSIPVPSELTRKQQRRATRARVRDEKLRARENSLQRRATQERPRLRIATTPLLVHEKPRTQKAARSRPRKVVEPVTNDDVKTFALNLYSSQLRRGL